MTLEADSANLSRVSPSTSADYRPPAALAREVIDCFLEQRWDRLAELLHPGAQLETGFSVPGARFGKKEVLAAAWVTATTGAFQPEYQAIESLDERTALVGVFLRYEIGTDLYSEREAAYLMTFEDGLLLDTCIHDSIDDALAAHRARVERV
jgi:hypothetical protein